MLKCSLFFCIYPLNAVLKVIYVFYTFNNITILFCFFVILFFVWTPWTFCSNMMPSIFGSSSSSFHPIGLLCFSQSIVQFFSSSLDLASWKMAFLSLLAPARMTFHPGSMVIVVPGLSGPHQLQKRDLGAAPANSVGLARGQECKKAYCQKSQVKKTVTVLERITSLGTFGDWRRLDHIVLFIAIIVRPAQPQFISLWI